MGEVDLPVETKQKLVEALGEFIEDVKVFLLDIGVDLEAIQSADAFEKVKKLDDAVNAILVNDDSKREYLALAYQVDRLFKAILPDKSANQFGMDCKTIVVLAGKIKSLIPPADISDVMDAVEHLLDESIEPNGYLIEEKPTSGNYLDLSKINFEALKKQFERGRKNTEAERLRGALNSKLMKMIRLNKSRIDYYQKFQMLIEEYNSGAKNVEAFYTELISLARDLSLEEQRSISENLNEEELALFDLLTRPEVRLTPNERKKVKEVARDLLDTLKAERLVLDWRKHQQTRAAVQLKIQEKLDDLPLVYDKSLYQQKCSVVYQHIYDKYYGAGNSVYVSSN